MRRYTAALALITCTVSVSLPAQAQHSWKQYTDERGTGSNILLMFL